MSTTTSKYLRMLVALLPPGKLWRLVGDTVLTRVLSASADELDRVDGRVSDLLTESNPATAVELLPEYEAELALPSTGTTAERQARAVSHTIAQQGYRPSDLQLALAPLLGVAPADVVVIENSHAFADSLGDDREIYRFYVFRDWSIPGTYYLASAQALLDAIAPSHTIGTVIETTEFLYGDPHSLYGRDLMGG